MTPSDCQGGDTRHPVRKFLTGIVEQLDEWFGSDEIRVTAYTHASSRVAASFDGYRIVQVSDLHDRWFGEEQWPIRQAVKAQAPDLIVLTGDLIRDEYGEGEKKRILPLVRRLCEIAPVYAIEGNHERRHSLGMDVMADIEAGGARVLLDQAVTIEREGQSIRLAGLRTEANHPLKGAGALDVAAVMRGRELFAEGPREAYRILLAHCPEQLESYARMGADLVISGHVHGGLVRLPGGRALLAPSQGWFPRYHYGWYQHGETHMQLSSGLGGPRIGIVPEIVCITLKKE